jgi:sulfoxide reductase heme-binding subunit YedZ
VSFERMPARRVAHVLVQARRRFAARDLLLGVGHALLALAATGVFYRLLGGSGRQGVDGVGVQLLRATGVTALAWSFAGLILGLLVGLRLPRPLLARRAAAVVVHRQLNLAVLVLILAHLMSFAVLTPGGSWLVALLPQTAAVGPLGYSAGVVAFYLAIVLGPSYYLRHRIGRRAWLVAHQFAALVYALALWHTLVLGADARVDGVDRTLLWVLQLPLLALFGLRLYRPLRPADDLDGMNRPARFGSARHAVLRTAAVVVGVCLAGFGVLYVVLAAMEPGLHVPSG